MKYLLTIALLLTAIVAHAQAPVELTFKVAPAEADVIWKGLRKLPVEEVEALMGKMRQQVTEQTTPKPTPSPVEPPKKE